MRFFTLKKYYDKIFIEITVIDFRSQNWVENRQISMEVISVGYFPNTVDPGIKETQYSSHSYKSDNNEQDAFDSQL